MLKSEIVTGNFGGTLDLTFAKLRMMSRSGNCNQFIYSSLLTLHVSDDLVVGMWAPSADPRADRADRADSALGITFL